MAISAITPVVVSLGTTETTILTVPAGETYRLDGLLVANTDSAAHTFRIYLYQSGGSASQQNALYYDVSIAANTTQKLTLDVLTLPANWKLTGQADAANVVNVVITGFTQS